MKVILNYLLLSSFYISFSFPYSVLFKYHLVLADCVEESLIAFYCIEHIFCRIPFCIIKSHCFAHEQHRRYLVLLLSLEIFDFGKKASGPWAKPVNIFTLVN
jgi:hypothetical protein